MYNDTNDDTVDLKRSKCKEKEFVQATNNLREMTLAMAETLVGNKECTSIQPDAFLNGKVDVNKMSRKITNLSQKNSRIKPLMKKRAVKSLLEQKEVFIGHMTMMQYSLQKLEKVCREASSFRKHMKGRILPAVRSCCSSSSIQNGLICTPTQCCFSSRPPSTGRGGAARSFSQLVDAQTRKRRRKKNWLFPPHQFRL